ncbi:MAG: 4'-phosphopantetheinyl transferase superfamily protein [Candidatus Dormibacteraeota bacterium]|nr:4'-phosphopantetheinyl transferase superfamily protein [Candidatus Dormibacteraeota bacterium]
MISVSGTMRDLLPSVAVVEEATAADWTASVQTEEEAQVAAAVEKRRREFAAGRSCARRALERLGWTGVPVTSGRRGEPVWPPGVVGSITHCQGYCAVAVASHADMVGLGIDAEVETALSEGVREAVCTADERRWIADQRGHDWTVLFFSAKESLYKLWYPLMGSWLDYHEAEVVVDLRHRCFEAHIRRPIESGRFPSSLTGQFALQAGRVHTAITLACWSHPPGAPRPTS